MSDMGIIVSSDGDFDKLADGILYNGKFVALLSQEDSIENDRTRERQKQWLAVSLQMP